MRTVFAGFVSRFLMIAVSGAGQNVVCESGATIQGLWRTNPLSRDGEAMNR